ncbi:unnamed protein product [Soboliphyme baturini]|uniref:Cytochrome P450 n=1 Tax=Soboliphyme baturini TaxID=241478 RepID=A0A183J5X4_9BILA|nr:unnamed protein product [Soboliphyme baturini]
MYTPWRQIKALCHFEAFLRLEVLVFGHFARSVSNDAGRFSTSPKLSNFKGKVFPRLLKTVISVFEIRTFSSVDAQDATINLQTEILCLFSLAGDRIPNFVEHYGPFEEIGQEIMLKISSSLSIDSFL